MPDCTELGPMDQFNKELLANAYPPDWKNPEPSGRYNMVVLGAGTAGLVTAAGVAGLGGKVALVEHHLFGGDCLNFGCVPSKALIASSRAACDVRTAGEFGVEGGSGNVDFASVMERVRRVRSQISHHDAAARFRDMGIDVYLGRGRFSGPDTVQVEGRTLRFARACIATGARAVRPEVEGLDEVGFLTNETVFALTELPPRLAVFGAGPLGCELAQAFARLGSKVTIIERNTHMLAREDPDAAAILARRFEHERIDVLVNTTVKRAAREGDGKRLWLDTNGEEKTLDVDAILVGAGRAPNVEDLGLEVAGVQFDLRKGVEVDDRLRTANPRIYAAGDVCLRHKFTHTADATARIVIQNALFWGRKKLSDLVIPWCTYTDPEIAHVGLYEREAREQGLEVDTFTRPFEENDRAMAEGATEGFVRVHVKKGSDRIVGATIVGRHAGEMISELSVAMAGKVGLGTLASVIHPYPTLAEAVKGVADDYNRTRLTPVLKRLFAKVLAWRR